MTMLQSGRSDTQTGCSCCNTKQARRAARHTNKRKEDRAWRKDQDA